MRFSLCAHHFSQDIVKDKQSRDKPAEQPRPNAWEIKEEQRSVLLHSFLSSSPPPPPPVSFPHPLSVCPSLLMSQDFFEEALCPLS